MVQIFGFVLDPSKPAYLAKEDVEKIVEVPAEDLNGIWLEILRGYKKDVGELIGIEKEKVANEALKFFFKS